MRTLVFLLPLLLAGCATLEPPQPVTGAAVVAIAPLTRQHRR